MRRKATVFVDDVADRRRFTCPRGHVRWEATERDFRCLTCAAAGRSDPRFEELSDPITGVPWPRERVEVLVGVEVLADGERERVDAAAAGERRDDRG